MSNERYIVTPKHIYELETQVIHAVDEQDAARISVDKYLETGKEWEVFVSRGSPKIEGALLNRIVQENIRLKSGSS